MAFSMKVDNSSLEGFDTIPQGVYEVKLLGFKPSTSKKGDSFNLNPSMEVINHPDLAGRKVFDTLNSNGAWTWPDFCHAFGLPMETDGQSSWLPGDFEADKANYNPDKPETWKYQGPLVGRIAKIEVAVDSYQGKENNKIRRYFCAVTDCATKFPKIRHSENLLKGSK